MSCYKVWPYKCTTRRRKFDITNAAMDLLVDHMEKLYIRYLVLYSVVDINSTNYYCTGNECEDLSKLPGP